MKRANPEQNLQIAVVKLLRTTCPDITVAAIPNGGYRRPIEAMMMKASGTTSGVPDLMLIWKKSVAFIELKAPKMRSRISPAQIAFLTRLTELGIPNGVATSIDEVLALLKQWGAPVRVRNG